MPTLDALPQIANDVDRLRRENARLTERRDELERMVIAMTPVVGAAQDLVTTAFPGKGTQPSPVGVELNLERLRVQVVQYRKGRS